MRKAVTTSISIDAPVSRVLSYIARPENMPEWFRTMLRLAEEQQSPAEAARPSPQIQESTPFWVEVDGERGTVDYYWRTTGGLDVATARVIPVDGGSQVVLTLFEPPTGCEGCGTLEERAAALESELSMIKAMLEAPQASQTDTWH
jgi:uncharacterized protein YndB with AHSA1/START domain